MRLRRVALWLLAAGAGLGLVGALPDTSDQIWRIGMTVAAFGVVLLLPTLVGRRVPREPLGYGHPERPEIRPLREGESYDTTVKLVTLPNVPLAELWCQRLKEQGIEAFWKDASLNPITMVYGGAAANPTAPAEVWVGQHDAERALQLLRELG